MYFTQDHNDYVEELHLKLSKDRSSDTMEVWQVCTNHWIMLYTVYNDQLQCVKWSVQCMYTCTGVGTIGVRRIVDHVFY